MPEIPDLEGYCAYFNKRLPGLEVTQAQVVIPIVVRASREEFADALGGRTLAEMRRVGKYLLFPFDAGPYLVVHAMLTGRFQYSDPSERKRAKTAFVLSLENGKELRYFDDRLMGKAYLAAECDFAAKVPRWSEMGPDAMSDDLTDERFRQRLSRYRGQIKNVLTTEQCVAGIGNAYSDEVLFEAGIHPYRRRSELPAEAEGRLYRAMRSVFAWATPIVVERMEREGLPSDHYRDHLRVHRRGGQPCPRCGASITEITAGQRITNFCRHCQT
ncbi:MAG: Fpg/Nei family DNA glycosylase [Chloroflexi bacterium]|nr:Fpg/Nei family DNA glycosylase [Chloroflexota bacterium]